VSFVDHAKKLGGIPSSPNGGAPPATLEPFELYTLAQLANRPRPEWQVDQLLQARALNVLVGAPGDGKSLIALGWSLCVAAGEPWNGHDVKAGHVLYLTPEGIEDLWPRADAWRTAQDLTSLPDRLHVVADLIDLLAEHDTRRLLAAIDALPEPPSLIVLDTLARAMPGGEENAARDVGRLIYAFDLACRHRPVDGQNASGLILHHSTADGRKERGSGALRGAANNMLSVKLGDAGIRVTRVKLKTGPPGGPWDFRITPVAESAVIAPGTNPNSLGPNARIVLEQLSVATDTEPISTTALKRACDVRESGLGAMSESTFNRALSDLRRTGHATFEKDGKGVRNWPTSLARRLVSTSVNDSHDTNAITATTTGAPVGRPGDSGRRKKAE
jgi:AAA domain